MMAQETTPRWQRCLFPGGGVGIQPGAGCFFFFWCGEEAHYVLYVYQRCVTEQNGRVVGPITRVHVVLGSNPGALFLGSSVFGQDFFFCVSRSSPSSRPTAATLSHPFAPAVAAVTVQLQGMGLESHIGLMGG